MAPGLKWLAAAACGCIVVALLIQRIEQRYREDLRSEVEPTQVRMLARELQRLRVLHEEVTRRDSVRTALRSHETAFEIPQNLARADAAQVNADIQTALASIQPAETRIGVFVMDPRVGRYPAVSMFLGPSVEFYAGQVDEQPYCAVVGIGAEQQQGEIGFNFRSNRSKASAASVDRTSAENVLGPCRWWGVYGAPGAGIEQWLTNGGAGFSDGTISNSPGAVTARRKVFGSRISAQETGAVQAEACLAGRLDQCLATINTKAGRHLTFRGDVALHVRSRWPAYRFGADERAMLTQIEREFGPEKFARFWHSGDSLEVAFASAFGVPLDRWVMQWARSQFGVEPRGPSVPAGTLLVSLFSLGMLVLVAVAIAERRQPG